MQTLEQLRAELKRLQTEAIAAHSRAAGGDKSAAARRSELMTAVQFVQVQIAEAEVAEKATQADQQVDRVKSGAAASNAITDRVRSVLSGRIDLAATAHKLAIELGEALNELAALHLQAGSEVRRSMVVDHALGLDTDDAGCIRAILSTLFSVAKVDTADAMRSLETLNFGIIYSPEDVRDTVANQNSLLLTIRENADARWADVLAEIEAQQEAA
ncbi:hypothetical protein [Paraburkholderia sediminicola]|uniref:hypothetical protein n=1 Tax=Paraburkholderia sediminicola TaxID=458836 RepID=UPI0038BCADAB